MNRGTYLVSPDAPDVTARRKLVQIDGFLIEAEIHPEVPRIGDEGRVALRRCMALIDTGASDVFIDWSIVGELALRMRNARSINTVAGIRGAEGYGGRLVVAPLHFDERIEFVSMRIDGGGRMNYPVILGRSFLERYRFTYDGPQATMLFEIDPVDYSLIDDDHAT